MIRERRDVKFPLWRKKVDSSVFKQGTHIPKHICDMWEIERAFGECNSKKDKDSIVNIEFKNKKYIGNVNVMRRNRKERTAVEFRLWFPEELCYDLKHVFVMSHMRALEKELTTDKKAQENIENDIPFWEFLDIEFDAENKNFILVDYYTQKPSFPELFKRLVGTPALEMIDAELLGKDLMDRIYKQSWKPKEELQYEIGAKNVIYMLIDTENKLLYVGEAKDLVKRLSQRYPTIPKWNYYRYNVLPPSLEEFRVPLERMLIRDMASLLWNKKDHDDLINISEYKLANDKIDK